MVDCNEWPIWKESDPILRDAVLFIDGDDSDLGWDKTIEKFHMDNNMDIPLEDFAVDVENLYYAPDTPH